MAWTISTKLKNLNFLSIGWVIICIGLYGFLYKMLEKIIDTSFGVDSFSGDLITYCFGLGMLVILGWMINYAFRS